MKGIVVQAIQQGKVDKGGLYRVLEVLTLLEEGRLVEAAVRVHTTSEEAIRKADKALGRLRAKGYEVSLKKDGDGYLAIATQDGEVVANVGATTPEEALDWLAACVAEVAGTLERRWKRLPSSFGSGGRGSLARKRPSRKWRRSSTATTLAPFWTGLKKRRRR
jgi:hypothetical protein